MSINCDMSFNVIVKPYQEQMLIGPHRSELIHM